MASPAKKPAGSLVVDIDLGRPKRPRGEPVDDLDTLSGSGMGDEGDDDVAGEMIAQQALRAFKAGDARALNAALKAHYDHCKASDVDDEPAPDSGPLELGGSGGPRSEY